MSIELDVLIGHPEHDLLFVATQVAEAAGLANPKASVRNNRVSRNAGRSLVSLVQESCTNVPTDSIGRRMKSTTVMFSEPEVYQMLLRGNATASEPFRKWVFEEVLPTIRKTGSYSAEQSTNPIAMGLMGELKALRGEVGELKSLSHFYVNSPRLAGSWPCCGSVGAR